MAGVSQGPTPWWQTTPQMGAAYKNLTDSAPAGYEYDPIKMGYSRTPTSAGSRVAAFDSSALGGIPSLSGLSGSSTGSAGAFGAPVPGAGTGSTGAPGTGVGGPVGSGAQVAPIQAPDMTGSNNAIFAAAKDKVGKLSRASLDSLNGELGSQGMLGGGAQVQGTRDIVANNAENLGQVDRDLATTNAASAADFAKTNYAGSITQRGQDIQAQQANAQLAIEQRNQQYQLLDLVLKGLGGSSSNPIAY